MADPMKRMTDIFWQTIREDVEKMVRKLTKSDIQFVATITALNGTVYTLQKKGTTNTFDIDSSIKGSIRSGLSVNVNDDVRVMRINNSSTNLKIDDKIE